MTQSPYDIDLDRNPANFQPLTPLTLLERAASVFPDQPAIVHGPLRRTYAEFYARARKLASALAKRGIGRGDTVSAVLANTPAMLEGALRRADDGRGAQHHQHAARCRHHRLQARPRRDQGADHRPRVLHGGEGGAGARQGEAAGHRLRRSGIFRRGRAARRDRIRGLHQGRRSGLRLADAGRRMGRDRAQLHVGHHRRSQGRGLSPPRRLSARRRQRAHLRHAQALRSICGRCRCSTATAGASRGRSRWWPARMSACARCARKAMYDAIASAQGDASVRRADRDGDAAQRAGRGEEAAAARGRVLHRRRAAAGGGARGDEGRGLQRHASLRPDRDLRPRHRQRLAPRMGRAAARRAGGEEGAPGRALRAARGARRARPRHHGAGAARRRDHRRGDVPRQRGDEGLSEEQDGDRRRRSPAAGSTPATSA